MGKKYAAAEAQVTEELYAPLEAMALVKDIKTRSGLGKFYSSGGYSSTSGFSTVSLEADKPHHRRKEPCAELSDRFQY